VHLNGCDTVPLKLIAEEVDCATTAANGRKALTFGTSRLNDMIKESNVEFIVRRYLVSKASQSLSTNRDVVSDVKASEENELSALLEFGSYRRNPFSTTLTGAGITHDETSRACTGSTVQETIAYINFCEIPLTTTLAKPERVKSREDL